MARNLNSSPLSKSILQHAGATRDCSPAALAGMPISARFVRGSGGRRAGVFSRLIRRRSVRRLTTPGSGPRCALAATGSGKLPVSRPEGRSGAPSCRRRRELRAFGPGVEFHLQLLPTLAAKRRDCRRSGGAPRSEPGNVPTEIRAVSRRATLDHDRARRSPGDDHGSRGHIRYCGRTGLGRR